VSKDAIGETVRRADLQAIRDGAQCAQEIARDTWTETMSEHTRLTGAAWTFEQRRTWQAWRVAVTCACLDKVSGARGSLVAVEVLRRWPTPARLAVADPRSLRALLAPLGLKTRRHALIALATLDALHDPSRLGTGDSYEAQSIRLIVDGDPSVVPSDKVLRAVRGRTSWRFPFNVDAALRALDEQHGARA
jgi:hypothetical protein